MKNIIVTGVGADIELFVKNTLINEIVSAEGYVKGTKEKPFKFVRGNEYFATTLDNVLAEFSIPPALNADDFVKYIQKSRGYIDKKLPKGMCTVVEQAAFLHPKWLQTENAKLFGCEPDFNAYSFQQNVKPNAEDATLRSAGGHIHIGYEDPLPFDSEPELYVCDEERANIIKALDLFIGIPSVLKEPDNKRKELYGKAGCFRPKRYGVEYRTISNYYLADEELTKWVFNSALKAVEWLNAGNYVDKELAFFVQDIINNNLKDKAILLMNDLKLAA